jgi:hypothetical protein
MSGGVDSSVAEALRVYLLLKYQPGGHHVAAEDQAAATDPQESPTAP